MLGHNFLWKEKSKQTTENTKASNDFPQEIVFRPLFSNFVLCNFFIAVREIGLSAKLLVKTSNTFCICSEASKAPMKSCSVPLLVVLLSIICIGLIHADIILENEVIKVAEIFDLEYAKDSNVWAYENNGHNQSKYYCTFRSNWNANDHPAEYPKLARWGEPLLFSHTKQHIPYIKGRRAPYGVEQGTVTFCHTDVVILTLFVCLQKFVVSVLTQNCFSRGTYLSADIRR